MLAMHVAAANPPRLTASGVDPRLIAREKDVLAEKAKAAGKPAGVIEKIVEGRSLKTYFKEVTLLEQAYVHEPSKPGRPGRQGGREPRRQPVKLAGFVRFALGEGIEKETSDFAAEVAKAAGQT